MESILGQWDLFWDGEGLPYFYPMTLGNKLLRPGGTIRGIIWESPPSIKHSIELYFFLIGRGEAVAIAKFSNKVG